MKKIIKKADKGSITTLMSPGFYWEMSKKHLSISEYYEKVTYNPKRILQEKVDDFVPKYKKVLADK